MQLQTLNLNDVLRDMLKMLKRVLGEDISLQVSYSPDLALVRVDVGMLEQVIMNLAVNARDAMPDGGSLIISTSGEQIDEGYVQLNPQSKMGDYVSVSVSDTGTGIQPENLTRIFDPFFTTKEAGEGTGLGLATVYEILQQHNGWVTVHSEIGQGAVFRIYLPAAETRTRDKARIKADSVTLDGSETLLLVEDEAAVRALIRNSLERYGYTVIEVESGAKALAYWNNHRDEIHLALTDIVMPDGLTEEIHAQNPAMPVIYWSGYSADIVGKGFGLEERPKSEAVRQQTDDDKVGLGSFGMKAPVLEHFRLTLVCGPSCLGRGGLGRMVDEESRFSERPVLAGLHYFFRSRRHAPLEREVAAQFEHFRSTGLTLDHVNGFLIRQYCESC